jgi:twinkle protein
MLHDRHREWLEARGIQADLADKFGLTSTKRADGYWLSVPYVERGQTINHKHRLTSKKDHRMDTGAPLTLWNHDVLLNDAVQSKPVVLTEGEWDALAAIQSGFDLTLSVPNGAPAKAIDPDADSKQFDYLDRCRDLTDRVGTFILATDADEPGRILAAELARRLGPERCRWVDYPEDCKDLGDVLSLYGAGAVARALNEAREYPVKGLYRLSDFPTPPPFLEIDMGIPGLSELIRVVPGTLTVLTGYAGHGKSSLSMSILANLMRDGMNVVVGSFETLPKPIMHRRLRACLAGCSEYETGNHNMAEVDAILEKRLSIIAQQVGEDQEMDLPQILDLAATAVLRDNARLLFIDPWNEVEHKRGKDETETDYANRAIRMVKQFARQYDVAVWIVAHPAKPDMTRKLTAPGLYQISGSAAWANKADYGIVSHRRSKEGNEVEVEVTKVRMGLPGAHGKLTLAYDFRKSGYTNLETGEFA